METLKSYLEVLQKGFIPIELDYEVTLLAATELFYVSICPHLIHYSNAGRANASSGQSG